MNTKKNKELFSKVVENWGSIKVSLNGNALEQVKIPLSDKSFLILEMNENIACKFGIAGETIRRSLVGDKQLTRFFKNVLEQTKQRSNNRKQYDLLLKNGKVRG